MKNNDFTAPWYETSTWYPAYNRVRIIVLFFKIVNILFQFTTVYCLISNNQITYQNVICKQLTGMLHFKDIKYDKNDFAGNADDTFQTLFIKLSFAYFTSFRFSLYTMNIYNTLHNQC